MSSLRRGDRGGAVTEIRTALAALGLVDSPDADLSTGKHVAVGLFRPRTRRGCPRISAAPRPARRRHRRRGDIPRAERGLLPARRPHPQPPVRRADVRRRRRHPAGATSGPRLLHRAGGRTLRAADPQRADVLSARVRAVAGRHLRPGDVALLVLSGFPGHRRFHRTPSARRSWSAGPAPACPASASSSTRAAAAATTGRSPRAPPVRSAKRTSCGTWQVGSRAA